jgi:hypothetical protein
MRTALVCIAKWEDTIEEWCNYHLKLGFDKIFIYQNYWVCDVKHENVETLVWFITSFTYRRQISI